MKKIVAILGLFATLGTTVAHADTLQPNLYTTAGNTYYGGQVFSSTNLWLGQSSAYAGQGLSPVIKFSVTASTTISGYWVGLERGGSSVGNFLSHLYALSGNTKTTLLNTGTAAFNTARLTYTAAGGYSNTTGEGCTSTGTPAYFGSTNCMTFFSIPTTTIQAGDYAIQIDRDRTTGINFRVLLYPTGSVSSQQFYLSSTTLSTIAQYPGTSYYPGSQYTFQNYIPFALQGVQAAPPPTPSSGGIMGSSSAGEIFAGAAAGVYKTFPVLVPIFAVAGVPIAFHIGRVLIGFIGLMF